MNPVTRKFQPLGELQKPLHKMSRGWDKGAPAAMLKGTSAPQMPGDADCWRVARRNEPTNNGQMNEGMKGQ